MSGVVVVAGVFEPGSVASLYQVEDERVMRVGGEAVLVGQRLVDENGNVGWEDVEVDARFFVEGYVNGTYVLARARGIDAEAPSGNYLQQPVQNSPTTSGTQQEKIVDPAPAVPDTPEPLPVGVPEAAADLLPLEPDPSPVSSDSSSEPAVSPPEPEAVPAEAVEVSSAPESVPAEEAPPVDGMGQPIADAPAPVVPDVPPVTEPVPSESAGTGEAAGAPSKQAEAASAAPEVPESGTDAPVETPPSEDAPPAPAVDVPPAEAPAVEAPAPAADVPAETSPAAPAEGADTQVAP